MIRTRRLHRYAPTGALRGAALAFGLVAAAGAGSYLPANAADIAQNTTIDCQVAGGRGSINFGPSKHLGAAAGTQRYSRWVFAQDGVNLKDRIGLFWAPSGGPNTSLRVAIDGPVSKPTQLISATEDTLVAVAFTSDQYTTRSWLLTINFPQETVVAVATSSGAVAVKAQVMVLSCAFSSKDGSKAFKSAADTWRR